MQECSNHNEIDNQRPSKLPHIVIDSLLSLYILEQYTSIVLLACPLLDHHRNDTLDSLLVANAQSRGTVDLSRPDCLISGGQESQDRRMKVSASGKQLLGYVSEYVHVDVPILSQLSSHPSRLRLTACAVAARQLAVLVYLVK
jgi:hypothetical protein